MFAFGVVSVEVWPTQMPVWALVIALLLGWTSQLSILIRSYSSYSSSPLLYYSGWHNTGHNKPTDSDQCHCGTHRWLCCPRASYLHDALQGKSHSLIRFLLKLTDTLDRHMHTSE